MAGAGCRISLDLEKPVDVVEDTLLQVLLKTEVRD